MPRPRDRSYQQFQFVISFDATISGRSVGGFAEVSGVGLGDLSGSRGPGSETAGPVRKVAGVTKVRAITLKRGVMDRLELDRWQAKSLSSAPGTNQTLTIEVLDKSGKVARTWSVATPRIVKYAPAPLNAEGTDVAIEELTLTCEGLELL